jgi:hypothetical protein
VHRRAVEGVKRPVYRRGVLVGEITEYSDKLLMFLLKRRRPQVYERSHDGGGKVDRMSVEEARSRLKALGLPLPLIEGDYEELDAEGETTSKDTANSLPEPKR